MTQYYYPPPQESPASRRKNRRIFVVVFVLAIYGIIAWAYLTEPGPGRSAKAIGATPGQGEAAAYSSTPTASLTPSPAGPNLIATMQNISLELTANAATQIVLEEQAASDYRAEIQGKEIEAASINLQAARDQAAFVLVSLPDKATLDASLTLTPAAIAVAVLEARAARGDALGQAMTLIIGGAVSCFILWLIIVVGNRIIKGEKIRLEAEREAIEQMYRAAVELFQDDIERVSELITEAIRVNGPESNRIPPASDMPLFETNPNRRQQAVNFLLMHNKGYTRRGGDSQKQGTYLFNRLGDLLGEIERGDFPPPHSYIKSLPVHTRGS